MRRVHTVAEVRAAEDVLLAELPEGVLMQRAAAGLAYAVADLLGRVYGSRVLLLVGAGNNGGDALYAGASLARRGALVDAVLLGGDHTHAGGLAALVAARGRVVSAPRPPYDVAIDGIVGIGASGGLRPAAEAVLAVLQGIPVVAVDVPSGLGVDDGRVQGAHVEAVMTVTFGTHKAAHLVDPAARACGVVHLVDLGLDLPSARLEALQDRDVAQLLPQPAADAHKYTRGVVGVRAGSADYPGAALLSLAGASCGLAGMVRFIPPDDAGAVVPLAHAAHPEVVVGHGRVQAWVVGSGGGAAAASQLRAAMVDDVPVVVDADALADLAAPVGRSAVLTPHAGELAQMLGLTREAVESDQLAVARRAAAEYDAVVLLKTRHSITAAPDGRARVTTVGPAWLATAGAGDVLGGVIGALLAAGLDPFDAASVGSWLHGAAATLASAGGPLVAGDVALALPEVCARLLAEL